MRTAARERLRVTLAFEEPVLPPVARGRQLGVATITAPGVPTLKVAVYAGSPVRKGSLFTQIKAGLKLLMQRAEEGPSVTLPVRPRVETSGDTAPPPDAR